MTNIQVTVFITMNLVLQFVIKTHFFMCCLSSGSLIHEGFLLRN